MSIRGSRWSALGAVLAALLICDEAWAQGSPILPETRPILAGPVSLYPTIALRDAGTDSNIYNDATEPKSDFTYTLNPRLFVVTPIRNTRFIGRALSNLVYFQSHKDQQSISTLFEGRYEVVGPGFRPFASAGFEDGRQRRGREIDLRVRQTRTTVSAGTDVDLTAVTALTAWISRSSTRWDRSEHYYGVSLADQLDYDSQRVAGGARLRVTPLTTIVASVEIQRDRFEQSPLRDANSLRVGPSIDFDTSAAITGHATAGFRSFKPLSPLVASYAGFTASTRLRYLFRDWTEFTFDADRDVDYSYDALQPYFLESGGRVTVRQRLIGPLALMAIGERHDLQYQRLGESSFDGRLEIMKSVGGGIGIQFRKQMRFEVIYERASRSSNEPPNRYYERRRLFASAVYGQ